MQLRDHQVEAVNEIQAAWRHGARNVILAYPTGAGKTVVLSHIIAAEAVPTVVVAHRQELVSQLALTLAKMGVAHRIMAPAGVRRMCVQVQLLALGHHRYDPSAKVAVAGVDSLRNAPVDPRVRLWVVDEAHHVLRENKWGRALALFPKAKGLGVTATPERLDGKGLGSTSDGVFDHLVEGSAYPELVAAGYLAPCRYFAPAESINRGSLKVGSTGDFTAKSMASAVERSTITGDAVEQYLKHTPGAPGLTFCASVKSATEMAEQYTAAGVPAVAVSAKDSDLVRASALRDLATGKILQVCNVDLLGEGVDLPDLRVVVLTRPTASLVVQMQQIGRSLRASPGKGEGTVLDLVGNWAPDRVPEVAREWSLDPVVRTAGKGSRELAGEKRARICPACTAVSPGSWKVCPECGVERAPTPRSELEVVPGDLSLLTVDKLQQMRAMQDKIFGPARVPMHSPAWLEGTIRSRHDARRLAHARLQQAIVLWDSVKGTGTFSKAFGTNHMAVALLSAGKADLLTARVLEALPRAE